MLYLNFYWENSLIFIFETGYYNTMNYCKNKHCPVVFVNSCILKTGQSLSNEKDYNSIAVYSNQALSRNSRFTISTNFRRRYPENKLTAIEMRKMTNNIQESVAHIL